MKLETTGNALYASVISGKRCGGQSQENGPVAFVSTSSLLRKPTRMRCGLVVLLPGFRNLFVVRDIETINICSGCQDVMTHLKQRRQDIPDQFLFVHDVKECLTTVSPHVPHEVDWEELADRVLINRDVGPAWDAYWTHIAVATQVREECRHWMDLKKYSPEEVTKIVSEQVMFDARLDDQEEAIKLTEWLLQDAERRAATDARRRKENSAPACLQSGGLRNAPSGHGSADAERRCAPRS